MGRCMRYAEIEVERVTIRDRRYWNHRESVRKKIVEAVDKENLEAECLEVRRLVSSFFG